MWYRFLLTCVVLGSVAVVPAQDTPPDRQNTALLVRMFEREMSLQPTAGPHNVGNCLTVALDGRAHLELRRQEFGTGGATLSTYERTLSQEEVDAFVYCSTLIPFGYFLSSVDPLCSDLRGTESRSRFTVPQGCKKLATLTGSEECQLMHRAPKRKTGCVQPML